MSKDRLNNLAILSIEKNISADLNEKELWMYLPQNIIIEEFV